MPWQPSFLPPADEIETRPVLKKLAAAHRALAELKGIAAAIPNEGILLDTLPLQEAKDSSAVENIITTHDELYQAELQIGESQAAKEVQRYTAALRLGLNLVQQYGFLSVNHLALIQQELEHNNGGYRRLPGTTLKNQCGDVVAFLFVTALEGRCDCTLLKPQRPPLLWGFAFLGKLCCG